MKLLITRKAEKDLEKLDRGVKKRIKEALDRMLMLPDVVDLKKIKTTMHSLL